MSLFIVTAHAVGRWRIKWFGVNSTVKVLSQPCCREGSRSNGLVFIAQQKSYLSLVAEKAADQMVWCQQYSESLISVLLQRRQRIKWFGVYSTAEVLSQPCCWESGRSNGLVSTVQWKSYLQSCCRESSRSNGLVFIAQWKSYLQSCCREGGRSNGLVSTVQWKSYLQSCCRESGRWNGLVPTAQQRSCLSLVVEKVTYGMAVCVQHSGGQISAHCTDHNR